MFDCLQPLPPDAIIALMEQCKADPRPHKVDLGVGVYKDVAGTVPIMRAVKAAGQVIHDTETTKSYVSTTGRPGFRDALLGVIFDDEDLVKSGGRFASAQTAGGSGALRLGAEIIKSAAPDATVWVSTPTWANHIPLISSTGLKMDKYPYYNRDTLGVDFEDMLAHLTRHAKRGDVVLLHGCCHNPTGADLSPDQWDTLISIMLDQGLTPFVDLAYFGLGRGLDEDAYGLRQVVARMPEALMAASCSKNFGLYKERVGVLAVMCETPDQASVAQTQLGSIQRKLISMPPDHGALLVDTILNDGTLKRQWLDELTDMRERMRNLRILLSEALDVQGGEAIAAAVKNQNGMFSTLPLSPEQAVALRDDHAIYITNSGRINIAGATVSTIPQIADALLDVLS